MVRIIISVLTSLQDGAYADVTVKLGLIKLLSKSFDLCEEAYVWFRISAGVFSQVFTDETQTPLFNAPLRRANIQLRRLLLFPGKFPKV
jgi:hypothetical protein